MMVSFKCPHCERILKIPQQHVGMSGICNHCRAKITVTPEQIPEKVVIRARDETFAEYLKRWFDTYWVETPTRSRTLGKDNMSIAEHNRSITGTAVNPELRTVVEGWLRLPEEVRVGIVTIVKAFESWQEPKR